MIDNLDLKSNINKISKGIVSLYSGFFTIFLSLIYIFVRININDNSIIDILKVSSFSLFLLFFPEIIKIFLFRKSNIKKTYYFSEIAITIYILLISFFSGILSHCIEIKYLDIICCVLGVVSFLYFFINYSVNFNKIKIVNFLIILTLLFIFSIFIISLAWGDRSHPFFIENFINNNRIHQDTTMFAAISNMIKTYGIPSTGLDGVLHLRYHNLIFWLFAYISKLLDINLIVFFNIGYQIIIIPLFLKTLFLFIIYFREYNKLNSYLSIDFWLISIIGLINIFGYKNYFILSETHLFALMIFFILLIILINIINEYKNNNMVLNLNHKIFFIFLLPIFFGAISYAKISIAFLALSGFCYLFLRLKLYKKLHFILSFLFSIILCYLIYKYLSSSISSFGEGAGVNIYSFINKFLYFILLIFSLIYFLFYIKFKFYKKILTNIITITIFLLLSISFIYYKSFINIFLDLFNRYYKDKSEMVLISNAIFWICPWIYFILKFNNLKLESLKDLKNSIINKNTLYIEILFVLYITGFIPRLLLQINQEITLRYFTYPINLFAIILILGDFKFSIFNEIKSFFNKYFLDKQKLNNFISDNNKKIGSYIKYFITNLRIFINRLLLDKIITLKKIIFFLLIIIISYLIFYSTKNKFKNEFNSFVFIIKNNKATLDDNNRFKLFKIFQELDKLSLLEKKKIAIFIPQSNYSFWNINEDYKSVLFWTYSVAFIAPAFTGLAMINGIPPVLQYQIEKKRFEKSINQLNSNDKDFIKLIYLKNSFDNYIIKKDLSIEEKNKALKIFFNLYKEAMNRYSYTFYDLHLEPEYEDLSNLKPLCKEALSKGFSNVIIIYEENDNILKKEVNCNDILNNKK